LRTAARSPTSSRWDLSDQNLPRRRVEAGTTLELVFRGRDHRDLDDFVDFSNFLSAIPLTSHLKDWNFESYPGGSIRVEIERTNEWQLILKFVLNNAGVVGGLIAAGFFMELGKQLAQKLSEHLFQDQKLRAEIKTDDDEKEPGTLAGTDSSEAPIRNALIIGQDEYATDKPTVQRVLVLSKG
jgi:hypothetical protein